MKNISKWNIPETYKKGDLGQDFNHAPGENVFACVEGEQVHVARASGTYPASIEEADIDEKDREIICRVAASKYLTSGQAYLFMKAYGWADDRRSVKERLERLVNDRILKRYDVVMPWSKKGLHAYSLDFPGNQIAYASGVVMHKGIRYVSYKNRTEKGIGLDGPDEIRNTVVANQILIGLLHADAPIQDFNLLETIAVASGLKKDNGAIIRASLSVKMQDGVRYLFEAVRDNEDSLKRITEKAARYERILSCGRYVSNNWNKDQSVPRLVICGESTDHNERIFQALKKAGFPVWKHEILFTEDPLWFGSGENVAYAFDGNLTRHFKAIWPRCEADAVADLCKQEATHKPEVRKAGLLVWIKQLFSRTLVSEEPARVA